MTSSIIMTKRIHKAKSWCTRFITEIAPSMKSICHIYIYYLLNGSDYFKVDIVLYTVQFSSSLPIFASFD